MTTKEQALKILGKHYEQWENDSMRMESGYHYESTFATMMQKVE